MKRILLSLFISFAILTLWVTSIFFLEEYQIVSAETSFNLMTPIRFPVYIYENILGFEISYSESEDDDLTLKVAILTLVFIVINIIFYSIFIYFILSFIKKLIRKDKPDNALPPEPPVFQ